MARVCSPGWPFSVICGGNRRATGCKAAQARPAGDDTGPDDVSHGTGRMRCTHAECPCLPNAVSLIRNCPVPSPYPHYTRDRPAAGCPDHRHGSGRIDWQDPYAVSDRLPHESIAASGTFRLSSRHGRRPQSVSVPGDEGSHNV